MLVGSFVVFSLCPVGDMVPLSEVVEMEWGGCSRGERVCLVRWRGGGCRRVAVRAVRIFKAGFHDLAGDVPLFEGL